MELVQWPIIWEDIGNRAVPPDSEIRITQDEQERITQDGVERITE